MSEQQLRMVRRMPKSIQPHDLGDAVKEMLTQYRKDVIERANAAGLKAVKKLVKQTKATVPKDQGDYAKSITYTKEDLFTGDTEYTWGAKAPHHRLTHILVHGHATLNGGRVDGHTFLEDALETVLPEYEKEVEEAINNVK